MEVILPYLASVFYSNDYMRGDTDLIDIRSIGEKIDPEEAQSKFHVLEAFFFLGCIWVFGKIFGMIHGKLIGEIIAGFLLGPQVLDIVPETRGWKLLGELGLSLLVIEGGTHVDTDSLKEIGAVAMGIGCGGTSLSIFVSWLVLHVMMGYTHLDGISAGVALSSTSIGMANTLLKEHNFLDSMLGRTVAAAAVVDDVLPLVLLAVLNALSEMKQSGLVQSEAAFIWHLILPVLSSIVILLLGLVVSLYLPIVYDALYAYIKTRKRLCPCRKSPPSGDVPEYAPPVAGKKPEEEDGQVFYHGGDDEEGLVPENRVYMRAKHSFNAFDEGQLSFVEGDVLEVLEFHPSGWWLGEISRDRIGRFPRSYCDVITDLTRPRTPLQEDSHGYSDKIHKIQDSKAKSAEAASHEEAPLQEDHPLSVSRQQKYDICVLGGVLIYGILFAALSIAMKTTPLLGCFMAGVAYARITRTHFLWNKNVSPSHRWMISIFFASVGFEIPALELLKPELVLWGIIFTIPSILTKLSTGLFVMTDFPTDCSVVGWAMVGRGELGFLMAQTAKDGGILDVDPFILTVWALVLSTFCAPFLFDYFLRVKRRHEMQRLSAGGGGDDPALLADSSHH